MWKTKKNKVEKIERIWHAGELLTLAAILIIWVFRWTKFSGWSTVFSKRWQWFLWQEYLSQFRDMTDALHSHIHLPLHLWIIDPHSRASKKNTSHGNKVLLQDTTHLIQRPCYQRGSLCKGPRKDLLTIVKSHKLQWYGHVSHSSGRAKTILQGTVKGGRRQGRHKKRWEDNVREWTSLEFAKSQRAVENRKKWRKLVVKSSVVPQ